MEKNVYDILFGIMLKEIRILKYIRYNKMSRTREILLKTLHAFYIHVYTGIIR